MGLGRSSSSSLPPPGRGGSAFSELQLTHVKNFCEEMLRDPYHIRDRKLQFFRDFLVDWEVEEEKGFY
jgi:hypothetical protein